MLNYRKDKELDFWGGEKVCVQIIKLFFIILLNYQVKKKVINSEWVKTVLMYEE